MTKYLNFMKTYRQYKCITQRKLSQTLDVDQAVISSWETGKALPPIETRHKIADILGIEMEKIFP